MTDPSRGQVIVGDALRTLRKMPSESVHCIVTSPPGLAGDIRNGPSNARTTGIPDTSRTASL